MQKTESAGGSSGTIVIDIEGVEKAAAVIADDAHAVAELSKRVAEHALPSMPPEVTGRVSAELTDVAAVLRTAPQTLMDAAQEYRTRAFWGRIADQLVSGTDLSGAELEEFKAAFASGMLTRYAEPWQADLAKAYADELHDREHPGGVMGFVKGVGDFFEGAWDAVKEPAVMIYHLTPFSADWQKSWGDLGHGLAYGVSHPVEFGKAVINLDALKERGVAYWLGNLAPAAAATLLSGGAAAGVRGAEGAVALERAAEGATALERTAAGASALEDVAAGGVKLTAAGDRFGEFASRATPIPGHTDVVIHGAPHGFAETPTSPLLDAKQVADMTRASPDYPGGPVRLVSCSTGCPGSTAARDLAHELGVDVVAPDDTVWAFSSGHLVVGPNPTEATGSWVRFTPEGGGG
jgi:hypothetical protein